MRNNFSVLMSVYYREKPEFLRESISSILNQSITPREIIIVKDGKLTIELDLVIQEFCSLVKNVFVVLELTENKGLGEALRIGLEKCSFEIVARMDSDDICHPLRFEKQLRYLENNPDVSVVGSNIAEFYDTVNNVKFIRRVPSDYSDIKKMMKKRNPINHVTVMFKKEDVLAAGSYKGLHYLEDYYLWVRMIDKSFIINNIDTVLVHVRTGNAMLKKRSDPRRIISWHTLQRQMLKYKQINTLELVINMINIIGFTYMPIKIKEYVYKNFLRR